MILRRVVHLEALQANGAIVTDAVLAELFEEAGLLRGCLLAESVVEGEEGISHERGGRD